MKVFMTGASGLIGRALRHSLVDDGHEVLALTRASRAPARGTEWLVADPTQVSQWGASLDDCDAVVNLAGEPIAQRWTRAAMTRIVQSRVGVTTALHHALSQAATRPGVLISASAIGYYGTSEEDTFDETSPNGTGFLARVCEQWEEAARRSEGKTRVVIARMGIVLTREGGALPKLAAPYRLMMGGPLGAGHQWMSWIHLDDAVRMLRHALVDTTLSGPLNVTAPEPVRNREFGEALAKALRAPNLMGAGSFFLKLGLGRMAQETLLDGQHVHPRVAEQHGFNFQYPTLARALGEMFVR